jgi:chromosome segregation ATPase
VVKREAERARALLERGRGRVLRFQRRLSRSVANLRRTDDTSDNQPEELQKEIAELRGDVRSVRDAMEALAKRLENTGPLRN